MNIESGTVERYSALHVTGSLDDTSMNVRMIDMAIKQNLAFEMPCGVTVNLTGAAQKCPNSGSCAKGHKECWVERYGKSVSNDIVEAS